MLTAARLPSPDPGDRERYRVVLPSDVSQVGHLVEVVAACCFGPDPVAGRAHFRVCTVVAEAVANAMLYGNRNDPTLTVVVEIELHPTQVIIAVTDEGEGFDPDALPDPTTPDALERTSGRGLYMIRRLADHVAFNDRGNTIWMTLPRC
ncbi:MAG: ATP-binding protein [Gemmatimonadales bacterium]